MCVNSGRRQQIPGFYFVYCERNTYQILEKMVSLCAAWSGASSFSVWGSNSLYSKLSLHKNKKKFDANFGATIFKSSISTTERSFFALSKMGTSPTLRERFCILRLFSNIFLTYEIIFKYAPREKPGLVWTDTSKNKEIMAKIDMKIHQTLWHEYSCNYLLWDTPWK